MLIAERLPFEEEVRVLPKAPGARRWRFDFTIGHNIAVEVEGGVWMGKGHTGGKKFVDDCLKYNQAALLGWRVFRFTPDQVESGYAIATIKAAWLRWR